MDGQYDVSSHHEIGQLFLCHLIGSLISNEPASPQDIDPLSYSHDLFQLMGDDNDRNFRISQLPDDVKQLLHLLGCQHSRGLIQNENLGISVKGFEDLYPLLQTNRQRIDLCIRIDCQMIFL